METKNIYESKYICPSCVNFPPSIEKCRKGKGKGTVSSISQDSILIGCSVYEKKK